MSAGTAKAAAWLRVAYAGVFAVAVAQSVRVLRVLGDGGTPRGGSVRRAGGDRAIRRHLGRSLILFGCTCSGSHWLAYRSGYAPKLLGVLLGVAGVGYRLDSLGASCFSQAAGSRSPRSRSWASWSWRSGRWSGDAASPSPDGADARTITAASQ